MYHDVSDVPSSSGLQRRTALRYKMPTRTFIAQLDAIAATGASPTGVTDEPIDGGRLFLTFDDGGISSRWIGDELFRRGWIGHFFMVSERIGTPRFMGSEDLRALRRQGHVVGSHSETHPDVFSALTRERMMREWTASASRISEILGEPCQVASVPGGDISDLVLETASEAGFRWLFTSEPEAETRVVGGCTILGRVCPRNRTPADRVAGLAGLQGWEREMAIRRAKVAVRRALGPFYRLAMRSLSRG